MANQKLAIICLVILVFANALGVYLNDYFSVEQTSSIDEVGQLTDSLNSETVEYNASGFVNILKAIGGVIFWSFGLLPWWLDMIFWIFRIIVYAYVIDVILP